MNYKSMLLSFVMECLLILLNVHHLVEAGRDIPMTKCCPRENFFYSQGFDSCRKNDAQSVSWPPIVYSEDLNQVEDIKAEDFNITATIESCSEGQIAVSTTKFKFIDDGSLKMEDERNLKVGQFCLNQVYGSSDIIARFCAPDPCIESNPESAGCIRKCCPNGMELNSTSFSCQPSSSSSFEIEFKNELGESVNRSLSSYVIRDGVAPKCIHGIGPLSKAFDDVFYVLPDAQIYIPIYPEKDRIPPDYCIDTDGAVYFIFCIFNIINQLKHNFTSIIQSDQMALICFPPQPTVSEDNAVALQMYPYFLLISSLFLIATFAVYCILPEIRNNIHGVSVMCFIASLSSFYIGMAIIQLYNNEPIKWLCIGIGK